MLHIADFYDQVVGPPRNMGWTLPWHEILHIWNERVRVSPRRPCPNHGRKFVRDTTGILHAKYFATLPLHRWIKRVMSWHPGGHRRIERQKYRWDSMVENFCRLKDLASWEMAAIDDGL